MVRAVVAAAILAALGTGRSTFTLTVSVSGNGSVVSTPAGISCPGACTMHARKGSRVVLHALPNGETLFSRWSAPCGAAARCTVTMSRARSVRAFFQASAPPPPPPPPPSPKEGHYVGTYSDGTFFDFDVQGTTVYNLYFDNNGECSNGGTSYNNGTGLGSAEFQMQADGSFSGTATNTFPDQTDTVTVAGTVTPAGAASGTMSIDIQFTNGPDCISKGTWTAQDQS